MLNKVSQNAQNYENLVSDLKKLRVGEEQIVIISGRAYVVSPAEVNDLDRVQFGRIIGD